MSHQLDAAIVALNTIEQAAKHATFWTEAFECLTVAWDRTDGDARVHCRVTQRRPDDYAWCAGLPGASKLGECDSAGEAVEAAQQAAQSLLNEARDSREREHAESTRHAGPPTRKVRAAPARVSLVASRRVGRSRR